MPKPKLLVVDLGTFCDFLLMETAVIKLTNIYDIVYVTDKKRKLPAWVSARYDFSTPADVTSNIHLNILDHQQSIITWLLRNPYKGTEQYLWVSHMSQLVQEAYSEHNPVGLVFHYGVSFLLWSIPSKIIDLPTFVLYFTAGLINKKTPYVFDPVLKQPNFELYKRTKDYDSLIRKTWDVSYYRSSFLSAATPFEVRRVLGKAHHIFCFDREITLPYEAVFSKDIVKTHTLGSLYNETILDAKRWYNPKSARERAPPESLKSFMNKKMPLVMMSFGSYSTNSILIELLPFIINAVSDCGFKILFHSPTESEKLSKLVEPYSTLYLQKGWLPYEWAVPHCDFVMFTGSVCLQTICLYNQCPMIFVPLLAEQFFWARNYQYMTAYSRTSSLPRVQEDGVPFINYTEPPCTQIPNLIRALLGEFPGVQSYLRKVATSMRKYDGKSMLYDLITSHV